MATELTDLDAELKISLEAKVNKGIDLSMPGVVLKMAKTLRLLFGQAAGQADQIWWDRRALAASATEQIDLAGTLKNAFGETITFANVKVLVILNRSDETLTHAGGTHTATDAAIDYGPGIDPWTGPFVQNTDRMIVQAGGIAIVTNPLANGWSVGAGTDDDLSVHNIDGADEALYDIAIIGESA